VADARELLAKMCTHGVAFDSVSFGGRPELTAQDVAAAIGMAGLCDGEVALLRLRYCGDQSSWTTARIAWYARVHDMGIRGRWPRPSHEHPAWMVLALGSLVDHCGPGTCSTCNGVAHLLINNKVQACGACQGSGKESISERQLATLANIPRTTWQRVYTPLLAECRAVLRAIDDRACAKVGFRLRTPAQV